VYADRTHHGKEEDIFFRELGRRHLTSEDRLVMQELIEEHVFGRQIVNALDEANTRYRKGDASALADVSNMLRTLVEFYPEHIVKEDKVFFPVSRDYLTDKEDQLLLAEFWEFDRKIIHEKYKSVIEALQTQ
jgi:hemerythrin-like domain-containing protein